jgi:hypothetical protein
MKSQINQESANSLINADNFNKILNESVNDVMNKYAELIVEYLKFIYENIKVQNLTYSKFIVIRGLETITNVFSIILYYTKNIELTYFQCQKSFYYYIEFIGQITGDQHSFLQLNSRDAITYVYKKTIFEINSEFKKNMLQLTKENESKFDLINEYIKIYKILLLKIINIDSQINIININNFKNCCNKFNNIKFDIENLHSLEILTVILDSKINNIEKFFEIFLLYLKKINKKTSIIKKSIEKTYLDDFDVYFEETSDKFISWLIN